MYEILGYPGNDSQFQILCSDLHICKFDKRRLYFARLRFALLVSVCKKKHEQLKAQKNDTPNYSQMLLANYNGTN